MDSKVKINGEKHNITIDSENVTQTQNHNTNSAVATDKVPFYKEWWFISILVAILNGVGFYWFLKNILFAIGGLVLTFLLMIIYNPKRRFYRVAWFFIFAGSATYFPIVQKFIEKYLHINLSPNPWLSALMIISAVVIFYLDYKENKA